jgi:hypothetical protein
MPAPQPGPLRLATRRADLPWCGFPFHRRLGPPAATPLDTTHWRLTGTRLAGRPRQTECVQRTDTVDSAQRPTSGRILAKARNGGHNSRAGLRAPQAGERPEHKRGLEPQARAPASPAAAMGAASAQPGRNSNSTRHTRRRVSGRPHLEGGENKCATDLLHYLFVDCLRYPSTLGFILFI